MRQPVIATVVVGSLMAFSANASNSMSDSELDRAFLPDTQTSSAKDAKSASWAKRGHSAGTPKPLTALRPKVAAASNGSTLGRHFQASNYLGHLMDTPALDAQSAAQTMLNINLTQLLNAVPSSTRPHSSDTPVTINSPADWHVLLGDYYSNEEDVIGLQLMGPWRSPEITYNEGGRRVIYTTLSSW